MNTGHPNHEAGLLAILRLRTMRMDVWEHPHDSTTLPSVQFSVSPHSSPSLGGTPTPDQKVVCSNYVRVTNIW